MWRHSRTSFGDTTSSFESIASPERAAMIDLTEEGDDVESPAMPTNGRLHSQRSIDRFRPPLSRSISPHDSEDDEPEAEQDQEEATECRFFIAPIKFARYAVHYSRLAVTVPLAALDKLKGTLARTPRYLLRVYTTAGHHCTRGISTPTLLLPSAFQFDLHKTPEWQAKPPFWKRAIDELRQQFNTHVGWENRVPDEVLSWTDSMLFAIVHLYLRHLNGETGGHICCIDTSLAEQDDDSSIKAGSDNRPGQKRRAEFFSTLAVYEAVDIEAADMIPMVGSERRLKSGKEYLGWSPQQKRSIHPSKSAHEYLSQGPMRYPKDKTRHAPDTEFIPSSLELIPELRILDGRKVTGLREVEVFVRECLFLGDGVVERAVTRQELDLAVEVAWMFVPRSGMPGNDHQGPPLYLLLQALAVRKRAKRNPVLTTYIKAHSYSSTDLVELLHEGYNVFPDNYPEKKAFLILLEDVNMALGSPHKIERAVVKKWDDYSGRLFLGEDNRDSQLSYVPRTMVDGKVPATLIRNGKTESIYERTKCGLRCECMVWRPLPRSKGIEGPKRQRDDTIGQGKGKDKGSEEPVQQAEIVLPKVLTNPSDGRGDVENVEDDDGTEDGKDEEKEDDEADEGSDDNFHESVSGGVWRKWQDAVKSAKNRSMDSPSKEETTAKRRLNDEEDNDEVTEISQHDVYHRSKTKKIEFFDEAACGGAYSRTNERAGFLWVHLAFQKAKAMRGKQRKKRRHGQCSHLRAARSLARQSLGYQIRRLES